MKVAVIGSRGIREISDFSSYLPDGLSAIISGGARGVDRIAKTYALMHSIEYIEILPDYSAFGSRAPLVRNDRIIEMADMVVAFWDGHSTGTAYMISRCKIHGVPFRVYLRQSTAPRNENQITFFEDEPPRSLFELLENDEPLPEEELPPPEEPTNRIW